MPIRTAPHRHPTHVGPIVFLAGSIEQGKATLWQARAIQRLLHERPDVLVANPRRDHWDSALAQHDQTAVFTEQVNWELDHLTQADQVLFVFDPATQSPITLLELGLMLGRAPARVVVACPRAFWRSGNVWITARRYGAPLFEDMEAALGEILRRLPPASP